MTAPLLSICIATYNREKFIAETLNSILSQLTDDVELLVVDGASTDNTEYIVRNFVILDPRIRYVRLPIKGGVDQDYCKAVELAQGEYCWLFTDDDLLKPGAIAAVITALRDAHELVIVNAEIRDMGLSDVLMSQRIALRNNRMYASNEMNQFFIDALAAITFIGCVVIRRSTWLSREQEPYFGCEFVHIGVIFQKQLPGTALILADPYICIRHGNAQWVPRSFDIWSIKFPKLVWSFEHISEQAKLSNCRKEPWRRLGTLLYLRGRGDYTLLHYQNHFSRLPGKNLWKIAARLISRMPVKALAYLFYYYCKVARPNPIILFDLKNKL